MNQPAKHEGLHDVISQYAITNELTLQELIEQLMFNAVAVSIYALQLNQINTDILQIETPVYKAEITLKEPANEIFELVFNHAKHE